MGVLEQEPYNCLASQLMLLKINVGQGLDCIGEITSADTDFITFKALRVLVYEPVPPRGVKIAAFMHFLIPAGDRELPVRADDITSMIPCPENFAELYRQAVSQIQIAREIPKIVKQ